MARGQGALAVSVMYDAHEAREGVAAGFEPVLPSPHRHSADAPLDADACPDGLASLLDEYGLALDSASWGRGRAGVGAESAR